MTVIKLYATTKNPMKTLAGKPWKIQMSSRAFYPLTRIKRIHTQNSMSFEGVRYYLILFLSVIIIIKT
jgi:hypothetical protein|tara:strand:- start:284 stop:487 length:204 start_codon:yes stop_codon:yes gene_type:complete